MEFSKEHNIYCSININSSVVAKMSVKSAGDNSHTNQFRIMAFSFKEAEKILEEKLKKALDEFKTVFQAPS